VLYVVCNFDAGIQNVFEDGWIIYSLSDVQFCCAYVGKIPNLCDVWYKFNGVATVAGTRP